MGNLALADLHVDRINEQDRVDRIQGSVLFRQPIYHLVGNNADRLLGDLGAVHLGQVRGDLPNGVSPFADREMTMSSTPVSRRCLLATILGSKLESRSRSGCSTLKWI